MQASRMKCKARREIKNTKATIMKMASSQPSVYDSLFDLR